MKIYNYLFYKTYILAQRSGNFNDVPVLGGLLFVLPCLMFNIFTIFGLLDAWGVNTGFEFKKGYKYIFIFSLIIARNYKPNQTIQDVLKTSNIQYF